MKRPLTLLLAFLPFAYVAGQPLSIRDYSFRQPGTVYPFFLGGNVDFNNSFVELPWPDAFRYTENLDAITITNHGSAPVQNPWLAFNESRFIFNDSDANGMVAGAGTFYDSALRVWDFFVRHVNHRYFPILGNRIGTPVEV